MKKGSALMNIVMMVAFIAIIYIIYISYRSQSAIKARTTADILDAQAQITDFNKDVWPINNLIINGYNADRTISKEAAKKFYNTVSKIGLSFK